MKRLILYAIVCTLLADCAGTSASQTPTWTPEAPKKIRITIELPTATDEPTFTPIPPTLTPTPIKISGRTVKPSGVVSGFGRDTLVLDGEFPGRVQYTADRYISLVFYLSNGKRIPATKNVALDENVSITAIEVVTSDAWQVEFLSTGQVGSTLEAQQQHPTSTSTATATATKTLSVIRTAFPTRTLRPTSVPTSAPTVAPPPTAEVIQPTQSSIPAGVTAICNDGTYSYAQHRRGACSHHSGVKQWLVAVPP